MAETHTEPRSWAQEQQDAAAQHGWAGTTWRALGTSVQLVVTEPAQLDRAAHTVRDLLDRVDLAASRFRADSELSRLNAAGGREQQVSPLFAQALRVALDAAAWTGGLVDPTVGASMLATGYDRTYRLIDRDGPPVTVAVHPAPGWRRIELDEQSGVVRLPAGVVVDLGATAKGLASDLASEAAAEATGSGVLLSLGGDISVAGPVPESGWPVRVSDHADPDLVAVEDDGESVLLTGGGLATSGTLARRWRRGGSWMHHLIDPRTGAPSDSPWVTASVTASTCVLANAASTAAVVIGEAAPAWLRERGLPYRLMAEDRRVVRGSGWPEPQQPQAFSNGARS
ncbi:MAG: FAD:protein transferase [Frankiales bacterium]|jgi:thiamine biosynthesis lipoprotein|nr:FAD:protein transferase [Frankiales bacterium]